PVRHRKDPGADEAHAGHGQAFEKLTSSNGRDLRSRCEIRQTVKDLCTYTGTRHRAATAGVRTMQDVYVVSAVRAAVGKAHKGPVRQCRPDDMAAVVINEAIRRAGIAPAGVQDGVMVGAMPEAEQGMNVARIAVQRAGLPDGISAMTINRF